MFLLRKEKFNSVVLPHSGRGAKVLIDCAAWGLNEFCGDFFKISMFKCGQSNSLIIDEIFFEIKSSVIFAIFVTSSHFLSQVIINFQNSFMNRFFFDRLF